MRGADKCFKIIRKEKGKYCVAGDLDDIWMERTTRKFFRCGSEDHLIAKCPNPPKDNDKWRNQVRFSEIIIRSSQKECDNGDNYNDQNIYAYMARMYDNYECPSRDLSGSLQLTNWILYSVVTFHMTPQVSYFIPGSI